jgi:hypothetical protein
LRLNEGATMSAENFRTYCTMCVAVAAYFDFYNYERLHQALDYRAPRQSFEEATVFTKIPAREKNRWP